MNAKHPGVSVFRHSRNGKITWRMKWRDPEDGKWRAETLGKFGDINAKKRKERAAAKSDEIAEMKHKLAVGAPIKERLTAAEAVEDFLTTRGPELREKTLQGYRESLSPFTTWCKEERPGAIAGLTPHDLSRYRQWMMERPSTRFPERLRSPHTTNRDLRITRVFLHYLFDNEMLRIDTRRITKNLRAMKTDRDRPEFLQTPKIRSLLEACLRHDAVTYEMTRAEHDGKRETGTTSRFAPVSGLALTTLLTGMRIGEVRELRWQDVDLEGEQIILEGARTKTRYSREIDLRVSPAVVDLLDRLKLQAGDETHVFGGDAPYPKTRAESTRKRLLKEFGGPAFTWQALRRSCGTYSTCAPGVFGAASAFMSAKRLGHSVAIAERHYLGAVRDIDPEARTIEAAMGIEDLAESIANSCRAATSGGGRWAKSG